MQIKILYFFRNSNFFPTNKILFFDFQGKNVSTFFLTWTRKIPANLKLFQQITIFSVPCSVQMLHLKRRFAKFQLTLILFFFHPTQHHLQQVCAAHNRKRPLSNWTFCRDNLQKKQHTSRTCVFRVGNGFFFFFFLTCDAQVFPRTFSAPWERSPQTKNDRLPP